MLGMTPDLKGFNVPSLYVSDPDKWARKIIATPNSEATAKEKIIALRLPDIESWFGEQAVDDTDLWGSAVRMSPTAICTQTGLGRTSVYRVLTLWASEGLILKKSEHYGKGEQFKTRMYLECSERFLNGDISIPRGKKERGVKKGTTFKRCPDCGRPVRKVYLCTSGHIVEHPIEIKESELLGNAEEFIPAEWDTF